ncbi:hypothetical protein GOODEAATRI_006164 [Goodea atripinnis]|uniref:Short myomegalin-like EB1 binding protein N-terminal domain-containing protein n=1 Tax=Goodea atripinnis TaxID=208336 RepID=A0ABV0NS85_9TELE
MIYLRRPEFSCTGLLHPCSSCMVRSAAAGPSPRKRHHYLPAGSPVLCSNMQRDEPVRVRDSRAVLVLLQRRLGNLYTSYWKAGRMLDIKMKETCRICGRELCGNQRRWIFHPASKLNLQVLLSHALGQELTRDGRGEFACSKCTFMLDRMYRFDTVIARVEALSIERLQRLLQEKHRLKQCIGGLYRRTNPQEGAVTFTGNNEGSGDGMVDISGLTHAKYCSLLQEDLVYSLYESWADDGLDCHHHHHPPCSAGPGSEATGAGSHHCRPSTPRCRGCSYWRVADSDYEAVCKVPRKLVRSTSCGPSTRCSASVIGGSITSGEVETKNDSEEAPSSRTLVPGSQDISRTSDSDRTLAGQASSSPSIASLETAEDTTQSGAMRDGSLISPGEVIEDHISDSLSEEHMEMTLSSPGPSLSLTLSLLQSYTAYRPVQHARGSKLPVLIRRNSRNGATRLHFLDPLLGMPFGERDNHMPTPELETPLIRVNLEENHNLSYADLEDLLEDLYKEYPPPPPHQSLVEEQQTQLNQYECAAGQCVSELQKAQLQVQSLQAKIQESEANNMAQELYHLIEGQNNTLCKLQELAHRNQLAQSQVRPDACFLLGPLTQKLSLFKDLRCALQKIRSELQTKEAALKESEAEKIAAAQEKDRIIAQLERSLQDKEQQLQVGPHVAFTKT